MFDSLSGKLQNVFRNLRGLGMISETNVSDALRDVRLALLDADVNFKVARDFVEAVKAKALGEQVIQSVQPGQQMIKIIHDELVTLLGSENARDAIGVDPLARIAGRGTFALVPQDFGIAPVEAVNQALARAGITWDDVAAVELNEAFAVQSLACVDLWKVDPDIVNTKGGAIAIGHPLGASGGRVLGTLAHRLRESGDRWGVAAICIGVGQGLAVVLENAEWSR